MFDYRNFGIMGGASFPKLAFGKFDINFSEHFGMDLQASLGVYWSIKEADLLYYFSRDDWSTYLGVGYQNWDFYGFSSSTSYNGIVFGDGNSATALSVPLGFLYTALSGFAYEIGFAVDVFLNAPADLRGKIVPEGQISIGYFF